MTELLIFFFWSAWKHMDNEVIAPCFFVEWWITATDQGPYCLSERVWLGGNASQLQALVSPKRNVQPVVCLQQDAVLQMLSVFSVQTPESRYLGANSCLWVLAPLRTQDWLSLAPSVVCMCVFVNTKCKAISKNDWSIHCCQEMT